MEITKRIAINTAIDEIIVKKVITHSLVGLLRKSGHCKSMEITGFGTFYLKKNRIHLYLINLGLKIEKFRVHLTTLTNKKAIDNLNMRIERSEEDLIEMKKRYGME